MIMRVMNRLLGRSTAPSCTPPSYNDVIGGFWGDHIRIQDWKSGEEKQRIWGHKPFNQRLAKGDVILMEMDRSWTWWVVTDIEFRYDPNDMFFGDIHYLHGEMKPFELPAPEPRNCMAIAPC